jgi:hypothetical protein
MARESTHQITKVVTRLDLPLFMLLRHEVLHKIEASLDFGYFILSRYRMLSVSSSPMQ